MTEPTVALALGGGGARGLAHIHVITAFNELGLTPTALSGTSIGAFMAAGMASGMTGRDIKDYVIEVFSSPAEVAGRFWRMRPESFSQVWNGPRTLLGNIDSTRTVRAFMPETIPARFNDLKIPLQVVATDFYGQRQVTIQDGDLHDAIAASAALPAIFRPVMREGTALVDGGIVNAVPYELLMEKADVVVGVNVVGGPKRSRGPEPTRIEALSGASQLMMQATTTLRCQIMPPHVMIAPPVDGIAVLDFLKARSILEATASVTETAKREIDSALEAQPKS